ncbi:MAG: hypothetical protein NVS1B4_18160 [Gemmatimonadaceae bacterium]
MEQCVKRYLLILIAAAACQGTPSQAPAPAGAPSVAPRRALDAFLTSVRKQDLQAMSVAWGTTSGPARDRIERAELEKRELVMMCYLGHDSYRVTNEAPGEGGRRVFKVDLTRANTTRSTTFTTIHGPGESWYVESADLEAVKDLCKNAGLARPS